MRILLMVLLLSISANNWAKSSGSCNSYLVRWANLHNSGKTKEAQTLFKTIKLKCITGENHGKPTSKDHTGRTKRGHSK